MTRDTEGRYWFNRLVYSLWLLVIIVLRMHCLTPLGVFGSLKRDQHSSRIFCLTASGTVRFAKMSSTKGSSSAGPPPSPFFGIIFAKFGAWPTATEWARVFAKAYWVWKRIFNNLNINSHAVGPDIHYFTFVILRMIMNMVNIIWVIAINNIIVRPQKFSKIHFSRTAYYNL